MNALEKKLSESNPALLSSFHQTLNEVESFLTKYDSNFSNYTDHSAKHTKEVFKLAADLLKPEEVDNLNADEIYILSMACILHDIGMCIPEEKIKEIEHSEGILNYRKSHPELTTEEYIRNIHHELSNVFIVKEWKLLKIPDEKYAKAIGLVSMGHRKVDLDNYKQYDPKFYVKSGRESVCLPYLASIIRIADELDITNIRTPGLLTKYYMPNHEKSIIEWEKHISTTQINIDEDFVRFEVKCSDQNVFAALEDQFDKIKNVINYAQRIVHSISSIGNRNLKLSLYRVVPEYEFIDFNPEGIKFSFNVPNVIEAFIGEKLYKEKLTSIREAIQNSVDSCRYKRSLQEYEPKITVIVDDAYIRISDNGLGMDKFIIENFFGRLGSSYYEQDKVKDKFEAIGQFGVGVFSYFLISKYVDIETKVETDKTFLFRIDKDPKSYFRFFGEPGRKDPGTSITLHIKDDFIGKYDYDELQKYIECTFRYIEFPIQVVGTKNNIEIKCQSLKLDLNKEIEKRIAFHYRNSINFFQEVKCSISNEEYEGECILFFSLNKKEVKIDNGRDYFPHTSFTVANSSFNQSQVSISQKGVYVNEYGTSMIGNIVGNINLKRKKEINIDRNTFSDKLVITNILSDFEVKLAEKLFSKLEKEFSSTDLVRFSEDFMGHFIRSWVDEDYQSDKIVPVFKKKLHVNVLVRGVDKIMTLEEVCKELEQFILIAHTENRMEIHKIFNIPVIAMNGFLYSGAFSTFIMMAEEFLEYIPSIVMSGNKAYKWFSRSLDQEYAEINKKLKKLLVNSSYSYHFEGFDSNLIITSIWRNKTEFKNSSIAMGDLVLNYNHPFMKFGLEYYQKINENKDLLEAFQATLDFIIELYRRGSNVPVKKDNLSRLNELLGPLCVLRIPHKFTASDFIIK